MKPTAEQLAAVDLFATGESIAIEAGAGTGKTSTLKLLAEAAPDRRGQYVAFNKAIVEEAKLKMPANVTANTAHSLAMRSIGHEYAHRLPGRSGTARMKSIDIARILRLDPIRVDVEGVSKELAAGFLAGLAMRAIGKFCQSADPAPTARHVPYVAGIDAPNVFDNNRLIANYLAGALSTAWNDITNRNGFLPFKHEHYLKIWQLSNPQIATDFILFDEAQDANPVMVAIVAAQTHAQLVWVGDSQQQIYGFTGAVNALAGIPADHRTFLTKSFRFGSQIANAANAVLGWLDADLRLEGNEALESRLDRVAEPNVILTRTNAEAIRTVLEYMREDKTCHVVGGGKEIVYFAQAADDLKSGRRTSHPELACFSTWGEVQTYVEEDEQGAELKLLVDLVDEFGTAIIVDALGRMPREDRADVVVSTAHKAKGREWPTVKLAGDFNTMLGKSEHPKDANPDELRLLYVAITRAAGVLDVHSIKALDGTLDEPPEPTPPAPGFVSYADGFFGESAEQPLKPVK